MTRVLGYYFTHLFYQFPVSVILWYCSRYMYSTCTWLSLWELKSWSALCMNWSSQTDRMYTLKALDALGNCQRPVFSLGVSQHEWSIKQQICENLGSVGYRSCKRIMTEKHPWVRNYLFLRYFRGSHFSQCFVLNSSPLPVPSKGLCLQLCWVNY